MEIALNGIKFGLVLCFLVGPIFFTILQTSIERGFWTGVLVAMGVSASDVVYVVICFFGVSSFMANTSFKIYMAYAGGLILVGFGIYHSL